MADSGGGPGMRGSCPAPARLSEFPGGREEQGEERAPRGSGVLGISTLGFSDISVCTFGLGSNKKT